MIDCYNLEQIFLVPKVSELLKLTLSTCSQTNREKERREKDRQTDRERERERESTSVHVPIINCNQTVLHFPHRTAVKSVKHIY